MNNLKKWLETVRIGWSMVTAYRLNFILLIIGPALVFYFIKVSLWSSIYQNDTELINGYNLSQMLEYHAWALIVVLMAQSSNGVNLGEDIRYGRMSKYLIYPFNFWEFHTANFISFQSIQFIISIFTLFILSQIDLLSLPSFSHLMIAFAYTSLVGIFWFSVQYTTGLLAFWLEETWTMRVMFQLLVNFLSGAIIPISFFPIWSQDILKYTPFPSLTFTPVNLFMGNLQGLEQGLLTITISILAMFAINTFIWRRGLFTAAGM